MHHSIAINVGFFVQKRAMNKTQRKQWNRGWNWLPLASIKLKFTVISGQRWTVKDLDYPVSKLNSTLWPFESCITGLYEDQTTSRMKLNNIMISKIVLIRFYFVCGTFWIETQYGFTLIVSVYVRLVQH